MMRQCCTYLKPGNESVEFFSKNNPKLWKETQLYLLLVRKSSSTCKTKISLCDGAENSKCWFSDCQYVKNKRKKLKRVKLWSLQNEVMGCVGRLWCDFCWKAKSLWRRMKTIGRKYFETTEVPWVTIKQDWKAPDHVTVPYKRKLLKLEKRYGL